MDALEEEFAHVGCQTLAFETPVASGHDQLLCLYKVCIVAHMQHGRWYNQTKHMIILSKVSVFFALHHERKCLWPSG